jgi:hypothetical protein
VLIFNIPTVPYCYGLRVDIIVLYCTCVQLYDRILVPAGTVLLRPAGPGAGGYYPYCIVLCTTVLGGFFSLVLLDFCSCSGQYFYCAAHGELCFYSFCHLGNIAIACVEFLCLSLFVCARRAFAGAKHDGGGIYLFPSIPA